MIVALPYMFIALAAWAFWSFRDEISGTLLVSEIAAFLVLFVPLKCSLCSSWSAQLASGVKRMIMRGGQGQGALRRLDFYHWRK
jgi:hypothetical protein